MANQVTNAAMQRTINVSNRMMEVLLDLVILSGKAMVSDPSEQAILEFLAERNAGVVARNERGFDISEMPWDAADEQRQLDFVHAIVADAMTQRRWHGVGYEPQALNVLAVIGQFKNLLPQPV